MYPSIETIVTGHGISAAVALQRQWPFQEVIYWRYMEVPYIKPMIQGYVREYPHKTRQKKHGRDRIYLSWTHPTEMGWISHKTSCGIQNTQRWTHQQSTSDHFINILRQGAGTARCVSVSPSELACWVRGPGLADLPQGFLQNAMDSNHGEIRKLIYILNVAFSGFRVCDMLD